MRPLRAAVLIAIGLTIGAATAATASSLITGRQIKDSSVTGRDIKNRSLTRADFKGSIQGPAGPQGAPGPTGAPGVKGDTGATGPPASYKPAEDALVIPAGQIGRAQADCPPDARYAVSGGYRFGEIGSALRDDTQPVVLVNESIPEGTGVEHSGWRVIARNDGPRSLVLTATAVCVPGPF